MARKRATKARGDTRGCRLASVPDVLPIPAVRAEDRSLVGTTRVPLHSPCKAISALHEYPILGSNVPTATVPQGGESLSQPCVGTSKRSPDMALRWDPSHATHRPFMGRSKVYPNKLLCQDPSRDNSKLVMEAGKVPPNMFLGRDPSRSECKPFMGTSNPSPDMQLAIGNPSMGTINMSPKLLCAGQDPSLA